MLIINDYFHNPFHRSGFMANLGKKVLVYSLCSMLASPFMVLPRQAYANTQNYTVFSGGTIYTMTERPERSSKQRQAPQGESRCRG